MARPVVKSLLLVTRTLHIYATMLSLIIVIVFSFSGIVINHRELFGVDRTVPVDSTLDAKLPEKLMQGDASGQATNGEEDKKKVDEQQMNVEVFLRLHGAHGERTNFDEQEDSIRVQFTAVGGTREYTIAKPAGEITLHEDRGNAMTYISDLHTGKGSGATWRFVIDLTGGFILFACLSGIILWIALPKRRTLGIISLVVSLILCAACLLWFLP